MINIRSKTSTRVISLFLTLIMLFSMLPISSIPVYADDRQIGNGGSGGVGGWVIPEGTTVIPGNGNYSSILNSNWGYKVSVYFAEQIGEDENGNPMYDWNDPTSVRQIGYNLYLRRVPMILKTEGFWTDKNGNKENDKGEYTDYGLGKAGTEVKAQSWSKGTIYTQTTEDGDWEDSLVKANNPQYVLKSSSSSSSGDDWWLGEHENSLSSTPKYETLPVTNCVGQFLDANGRVVSSIEQAAIQKDANGNPIYRVEENSVFRYFHTEELTKTGAWYNDVYYVDYPLIHSWLAFILHLNGLTGETPDSETHSHIIDNQLEVDKNFDSINDALLVYAGGTNIDLNDLSSDEYAMHDFMCRLFNMDGPAALEKKYGKKYTEKMTSAVKKFISVYVENIKNNSNGSVDISDTIFPYFNELKGTDVTYNGFNSGLFVDIISRNTSQHVGCKDKTACLNLTKKIQGQERTNYLAHFGEGTAFYKALVAMYNDFYGLNISNLDSISYSDFVAKLRKANVQLLLTSDDLALPLTQSFNSNNYKSAEYIKSYFLNPVVLNIVLGQVTTNAQYSVDGGDSVGTFNFLNGVYKAPGSEVTLSGQYKIYVEPAMFRMNGKYGLGAFTWRDLMTEFNYKQDNLPSEKKNLSGSYTVNGSIIAAIYMAIPNLPNALYLEREDNSLFVNDVALGKASGDFVPTPVVGTMEAGKASELQIHELALNQPLNTLGVAVFTSPGSGTYIPDKPQVLKTYVNIDSIDENGNITYSKALNSELEYVQFKVDAQGNMTQVPKEIGVEGVTGGRAYLNDIVTTDKDFTFDAEKSEWVNTELPTNIGVELQLHGDDIAGYRFGIFTGDEQRVLGFRKTYLVEGSAFAVIEACNELNAKAAEANMSGAFEEWYLDTWLISSDGQNDYTLMHKDLWPRLYSNYESVKMGQLMTVKVDGKETTEVVKVQKSDKIDDVLVDVGDISQLNTPANNLILRYIVVPTPSQVNILEIVTKDAAGKIKDTEYRYIGKEELKIDGSNKATVQELKLDNPEQYSTSPEIVNWVTNSVYPTYSSITSLPAMSDGGKTGTSSTISNYPSSPVTHNLYVMWKVEKSDIPPFVPKADVPEWRLSKLFNAYTDVGEGYADMSLSIKDGCHDDLNGTSYPYLTNEGTWKYKVYNANGTEGRTNLKVTEWLHSETIKSSKTPSSVTINSPNSSTPISANINLIKNTNLSGLRLASWVGASNKQTVSNTFDLTIANTGTVSNFTSDSYNTLSGNAKQTLDLRVKNLTTYRNYYLYDNGYPYTCHHYNLKGEHSGCHDEWQHVCAVTYRTLSPDSSYVSYTAGTLTLEDATFDRYTQNAIDTSKLFKTLNANAMLGAGKKFVSENGFTTLRYQLNETLNIYPEYGMLLTDNDKNNTIQWVVGDQVRKINPIVYQTLEHKVYVIPASNGTSVATDSRATTAVNALVASDSTAKGKQLIYKGAGVNTAYKLQRTSSNTSTALLTVKTYALDIGNATLKTAWSNNYNPYDEHSALITNIKNSNKASITEKLLVDAKAYGSLDLDNAKKTMTSSAYKMVNYNSNGLKVDSGNAVCFEHKLIVRGGKLIAVKVQDSNGNYSTSTMTALKNTNNALYNAIVGMGLYVENGKKENTVFKDFEHMTGRLLDENLYATKLLDARKSIDGLSSSDYSAVNVATGKGWYSEDTTVLVIKEYTSNFEVPAVSVSDKLPMSINNLTTPTNKNQFFSNIAKGYTYLKYDLPITAPTVSGITEKVSAYFEFSSYPKDDLGFGRQGVDYLVPNVSISDTTRLN